MRFTLIQCTTLVSVISTAVAQVSFTAYANDFVDPDYILAKNFGANTQAAQASIMAWAGSTAVGGPWSVMDKNVTPPSGNKHDYMSWAPYWWPDCSKVGNTTELTPEQIWVTCPYVSRDGQFNPDGRLVNDVGAFQSMSEAVFYNTLAWVFATGDSKTSYENIVVKFLKAWFLDDATKMNPNLAYGQMQRGPTGQVGSHTGVLDLKAMAKVTSAILILRKGGSTQWTSDLDNQLIAWTKEYITWLETAEIAIEEALATNNHGTFYYNQLAALKVLVNDNAGAKNATNTYFNTLYMNQITASGEQPLEAVRTRPYHYHSYNLAAMITNARIEKYADPSSTVWNKTTAEGATIKTALDFALGLSASATGESKYVEELYPNVAAVAAVYGDAGGKYDAFLKQGEPGFMGEPYILWNQPFALDEASGRVTSTPSSSSPATKSSGKSTSTGKAVSNSTQGSGASSIRASVWVCISALTLGAGFLVF
ncbi:chondroitin AC/alginate lyase [Pholiota conissans]|uniref:Chondroitin AC/alginate lyase n=1 Tax=Pholiota conissans TaxID=109636 RepID=A0A9P5YU69_9AGAR|nr:chondroitin AC/alginate lyase [Pholiota conissans]